MSEDQTSLATLNCLTSPPALPYAVCSVRTTIYHYHPTLTFYVLRFTFYVLPTLRTQHLEGSSPSPTILPPYRGRSRRRGRWRTVRVSWAPGSLTVAPNTLAAAYPKS